MITVTFLVVWFLHCDTATVHLISFQLLLPPPPSVFPPVFFVSQRRLEDKTDRVGAKHLPDPSQLLDSMNQHHRHLFLVVVL